MTPLWRDWGWDSGKASFLNGHLFGSAEACRCPREDVSGHAGRGRYDCPPERRQLERLLPLAILTLFSTMVRIDQRLLTRQPFTGQAPDRLPAAQPAGRPTKTIFSTCTTPNDNCPTNWVRCASFSGTRANCHCYSVISSLNQLSCPGHDQWRDFEAKRLRDLKIEHQIKRGWRLNR